MLQIARIASQGLAATSRALPRGGTLPEADWDKRHRVLVWAIEVVRCAGTQFDPAVVAAFCAEMRDRERAGSATPAPEPLRPATTQ